MKKSILVLGIFLTAAATSFADTVGEPKMKNQSPSGLPMATIPNTEVRTIISQHTGDQYDLYFFLPSNYDEESRIHPVLFTPDAFFKFGGMCDLVRNLQDSRMVQEFIMVGISYGVGWGQEGNNRDRDFTFRKIEGRDNTGGADNYLAFLRDELVPFVEKHYPIDTANMTFHGASSGGTFAPYVMFKDPTLFKNLIIASPALKYYTNDLSEVEREYSAGSNQLPVRAFFTIGTSEHKRWMLGPFFEFLGILEGRDYVGLELNVMTGHKQIHQTSDINLMPWVLMELFRREKD